MVKKSSHAQKKSPGPAAAVTTNVSVSSGEPVPGAGVRQQYVKHDLFTALLSRVVEKRNAGLVISANVHKDTDIIVIPDDPEIPAASQTALKKAKRAKVVRVSRFLKQHELRPLDDCELSYIGARLGHIGEPCVCDKGCYSKACDIGVGRCRNKKNPKNNNNQGKKKRAKK